MDRSGIFLDKYFWKKKINLNLNFMQFWRKLLYYVNFTTLFKKNDKGKNNMNLKIMHGINRLSLLLFIVCLIVIILRFILR